MVDYEKQEYDGSVRQKCAARCRARITGRRQVALERRDELCQFHVEVSLESLDADFKAWWDFPRSVEALFVLSVA